MNTLETVSGKLVDVLNPNPDDIVIEDIAWALSRMPRFAGHTIPLIPYTVAQHSVNVAKEASKMWLAANSNKPPKNLILSALLHDAAETYIGDIPSPVKHLPNVHEAISRVENGLMKVILEKFNVGFDEYLGVYETYIHEADLKQRAIEAHAFMFSRGKSWNLPHVSLLELQEFEAPWTSVDAYDNFMSKFRWTNLL